VESSSQTSDQNKISFNLKMNNLYNPNNTNNETLFVDIVPNFKDQIMDNDNNSNLKIAQPKALKLDDKQMIYPNECKNNIFNVSKNRNSKDNSPKFKSNANLEIGLRLSELSELNTKSETKLLINENNLLKKLN